MTVELREYTQGDRPQLIELIRELQLFETALFDRSKPPEDIGSWYVDNILAECGKYNGTVLIVARQDLLLGFAVLLAGVTSKDEPDEVDYTYAYVTELAVTQAARGTGIGRRLLSKCEEIARAEGVKWLRISVLARNHRAVQIYEKFGFAPLHHRMEKSLD